MVIRYAIAGLALLACQPAAAEDAWYVGIGAAFSRTDIDVAKATEAIGSKWSGAPTTVDDKGDGLKIYGGWQASRYFALEAGYTDFGRASTYSTLLAPTSRDTASVEWSGYGLDFSLLGQWWIGEVFSLYGRGGLSAWEMKRKIVEDGSSGYFARTSKGNGVSALAGAGFAVRFMQQGTLRAEFQRYFGVDGGTYQVGGRGNDMKTDIDVVSVSAHYHF
jgi:OOP family OmpA-OmpF porin